MSENKSKKIQPKILGSSFETLDELITRVLCDTSPRRKVDAAYLFGETANNQASVLKAGMFLYGLGPAKKIALCNLKGGAGYPGFARWRGELIQTGVLPGDIVEITPAEDFPPSTDAEAVGLVRHAKEHAWKSVYVVAPPLHQLRAFISSVSAAIREKSNIKIYSFHGIAQTWEEHIVHSQGIQKGTRSELLGEELKKIETYYKKGDLVSAEEILKYLDWRDKS